MLNLLLAVIRNSMKKDKLTLEWAFINATHHIDFSRRLNFANQMQNLITTMLVLRIVFWMPRTEVNNARITKEAGDATSLLGYIPSTVQVPVSSFVLNDELLRVVQSFCRMNCLHCNRNTSNLQRCRVGRGPKNNYGGMMLLTAINKKKELWFCTSNVKKVRIEILFGKNKVSNSPRGFLFKKRGIKKARKERARILVSLPYGKGFL